MTELRDILRQILREAAAGDPAVVGTVQMLADCLEERGDARALWIAGLATSIQYHPENGCVPACWTVGDITQKSPVWGIATRQANIYRELADRVMKAMTRECLCGGSGRQSMVARNRYELGVAVQSRDCACQGDGWLIAEAVACRNRRETVKEFGSCGWSDRIADLERQVAKYKEHIWRR